MGFFMFSAEKTGIFSSENAKIKRNIFSVCVCSQSLPKGSDILKKSAISIACVSIAAAACVMAIVPRAVESSAPAAETLRPELREYRKTVKAGGSFSYLGQREITSALPLVIERFSVSAGDTVSVGDEIATVDRRSSAALIESMGQVKMLAIPASNLEAAIAMIPEKITADCSGRVISTAPGGTAVQSGSSLASVANTDQLSVSAAVSELDIAKVEIGQTALITLAAYPGEVFSGKVTDIAQTARDQYSGAVLETVVDVRVTPDEFDERLKPGLSADVEIAISGERVICVLPYDALGQDAQGEYVFVYEDGKAARRDVITGAEFADGTEIVSGIDESDVVFKDPEGLADRSYIRM